MLRPAHPGHEFSVEQQVWETGLALEGPHDRVQEAGPDNAAALPYPRHLAQINVPLQLFRSSADQAHALCIGTDFRGIQSIVYRLDQFSFVSIEGCAGGGVD